LLSVGHLSERLAKIVNKQAALTIKKRARGFNVLAGTAVAIPENPNHLEI
jgi:hypothetical protein